jgi:hypothetical protein
LLGELIVIFAKQKKKTTKDQNMKGEVLRIKDKIKADQNQKIENQEVEAIAIQYIR